MEFNGSQPSNPNQSETSELEQSLQGYTLADNSLVPNALDKSHEGSLSAPQLTPDLQALDLTDVELDNLVTWQLFGESTTDRLNPSNSDENWLSVEGADFLLGDSQSVNSQAEQNQVLDEASSATFPLNPYPLESLNQAIALTKNQLAQLAVDPEWQTKLQTAFGTNWSPQTAQVLLENLAQGQAGLTLKITEQLPGNGAYAQATNTVYLNRQFIVAQSENPAAIATVLLEEIGHYLDAQLNETDTPGDEGEIFAALLQGKELSPLELAKLQAEDDSASLTLEGKTIAIEQSLDVSANFSTFAVKAEGTVTVNGSSDFDGEPLNANDDALIYGGQGFTINGSQVLPVQRDASGVPLLDEQGRQILVEGAVAVASNYLFANSPGNNNYSGLNPPQIVETQSVEVPSYQTIVDSELEQRIPPGTEEIIFNVQRNRLNNLSQWNRKFPPGGSAEQPTVVRVTGGGLTIPNRVDLSNYVIIVEQGDINFNGSNHDLENVVLVTQNGNINLNKIDTTDVAVFAQGSINTNRQARFGGRTLIANATGNITFSGATRTTTEENDLLVISQGNITYNGGFASQGRFLSAGDFTFNGSSTLIGAIAAKGNIRFNGSVNIIGNLPEEAVVPEISVGDVSVTEGSGGTTLAQSVISLSAASNSPVTVDFTTANGSATAPEDYSATSGTVTFAPGEITKTITVEVVGDEILEADESFTVNLSNPSSATLADFQGNITIINDDQPPELTIEDVTLVEGDNQSQFAQFSVNLSSANSVPVTVDFATADGTAVAGVDYSATSGTVTFAPGETTKTIAVSVLGDSLDELDESFTVNLSNALNAQILDDLAVGTIADNDAPPSLSINNISVNEGDGNATFEVTLSNPSAQEITFDYTTNQGSAVADSDYQSVSGTITIAPGSTNATITVPVNEDALDESEESFTVAISNPSNATIADAQGEALIADNDAPPNLSVDDVVVSEEDATASFIVNLDAASSLPITVDYATADGSAIAGEDYQAVSGTVTFAPGETSHTIVVPIISDSLDELDENLTLNLSNPNNVVIANASASATIIDQSPPPQISVSDVSVTEGDSATGIAEFVVSLSQASSLPITVQFATADGSAIAGADYEAVSGTLTFEPGETSKTIAIAITGDTIDEIEESFTLNLTNPSNATIADEQGNGSISDDDLPPQINLEDVTLVEGSGGSTQAQISVSLSSPSSLPVSVDFATVDGSGFAGEDYQAVSGTLTFALGETSQTIAVPVISDSLDELDENFSINFSNPSNASLPDNQSNIIITDDDAPPQLTVSDIALTEGNDGTSVAEFVVTLDAASSLPVTVDYATADGSASAEEDYQAVSGTLTFAPGETAQTIAVPVISDSLDEYDENFSINFSNPSNATIINAEGEATLFDDDAPPQLAIGDLELVEGDEGTTAAEFIVTLDAISSLPISVDFTTVDGSAVAGADYQAVSGTLTFAPGETTKTISIPIIGDLIEEASESFTVSLSNALNAQILDNQGLGSIINDDEPPQIIVSDISTTEGDGEQTQLEFSVTLSVESAQTVSVDYATVDGTAVTGEDYTAISGTLTFAPGETQKTVTVDILGDTIDELDETISLELTNPSNAIIGDEQGLGTILDDDQLVSNDIILSEGSDFQTVYEQTLEIPADSSFLRFSFVDLNFDTSDANFINDAFEAALVDAQGNSLVHTIGTGRDSLINFTEGQAPQLASGVTLDGTTVSVNLSHLEPGVQATLILRLVNDDSDTTTSVRITNIELQPGDGTVAPNVTPAVEVAGNSQAIDFSLLGDVSPSAQAEYGQTSFNSANQVLSVELALNNAGTYWFNAPLLVAVTQISDPTIQVLGTDGITPEGLAYYDFSHLVTEGALAPGATSQSQLIRFFNPEGIQFNYELVVLSQLNFAPVIASEPPAQVIGGQPYSYQIEATDANEDELNYSLLVAPEGMTIDPATGLINWQTDTTNVANHSVIIEVSDSRGGKTQQSFTLEVLGDTPNRPPNFTSAPVVDAWINQLYTYDADAVDPDQDSLNYSVILGPDGLKVNSETGAVEWTPPPVVVLGDTVLGQISLPGEQDEFSFSGSRGQRIYFDPLSYSGSANDWDFQVFSPSGEELINTNLVNNQLLTLPEAGNYRVVVGTSGDTTGNYGFSVIDIAQVPVAEWDSPITGQLAPGSEDDVYRFTGNAGQKLFIDSISNSGSLNWILYGPDNQVVESSSNFNDMELYLPAAGEYLLALRGRSSFTSTVEYSFEIITPDEVSNEISIGSHTAPVIVAGEIGEKGEEDLYTFAGVPGQRVYFDRILHDSTIPSSHTAKIISPSGEEILSYNFRFSNDPEPPLTLLEAGTYTVIIDASSENTGSYSFSLLDLDLATDIDSDTNISGTIEPGQATHVYQFNGTAGQRIYLNSNGGTSGTDWALYDSGNNLVVADNFSSDMEIVLDDSDSYTLLIQGRSDSNRVNYEFSVITPDSVTAPLSLDTTVTGAIAEKGEQDEFTFSGSQGQRLFLDTLVDSFNLRAILRDPSGNEVFNSSMSRDFDREPVILPESGAYQLIIDGTGEATADYSFRLADLSAAPILALETPTSGTIEPGSEIEVYRLAGTQGQRLYFQGQASSSNPNWLLYSPGNQELVNRQLNQDFEYVLPSDGTYYLVLRGDGSASDSFDYTLQVVGSTDTTASIALDTTVSGAIAKLGEQHRYSFSGSVGQQLYFDAIAGDSNLTASLHNASGNVVWSGDTADDGIPVVLTSDGTYELTIDGEDGATGNYSFQWQEGTAPLNLASVTSGSLAAQETALYQFNGSAGEQLSFENLSVSPGLEADWVIYAQVPLLDGTTVVDSGSLNSDLAVVLPSDGSYTLAVRNLAQTQVDYEFEVVDISDAPIGNSGVETLHSGTIAVAGEVDNYTFSADAGTLVYFDGQQGSGINVKLLAPDGSSVFGGESVDSDEGAFLLEQTGNYTLEVDGAGNITGSYRFKLVELTNAPVLNLNSITDVSVAAKESIAYQFTGSVGQKIHFDGLNSSDPNLTARLLNSNGEQITFLTDLTDNIALQILPADGTYYLVLQSDSTSTKTASFQILDDTNATPLLLDTPITGDFGISRSESQLYKFTGSAGQRLYFESSEGDSDNFYILYGADGEELFSSRLSSDYELEALPSDGEYTLVVSGNGDSNDSYRLQVITPDALTAPLTVGNTVTGELLEAGEQHTYTFTGSSNQRLLFDSLTATGGITAQLYSPSGVRVISTGVNDDEEPVMLSETGTYRLVIDGTENNTGTYSFRLLDWSAATPVSFDTPITGDFGSSGRETVLYRFTGSEGQELFFDRTAGSFTNSYILYTADGEQLNSSALSSDLELILPYTGDYVLVLDSNGSSSDTYAFEIVTPESTTSALTIGETISNTIGEAGESDSYTFSGNAGQILYFDSLFDTSEAINVRLITPAGKEIWNQNLNDDRQPFILPEVGTYTLKIARQSTNDDITDSYSFRLLDLAEASDANFDSPITGNFGSSRRETIFYTFSGSEGQKLFFDRTQGSSSNRYTLYDQYGKTVFDERLSSDREAVLPSTGTYYLALRSFGTSSDDYALEIVIPESVSEALSLGETISGAISEAGESDSYTFSGSAGQILYFDSLANANAAVEVRLVNSSGQEIWSQSLRDDTAPFTLDATGTYTLEISGTEDNAITGNYSFRLLDFAGAQPLDLDTPLNGDFGTSRRETKLYQLTGIAGQPLYFDLTAGVSSNDYVLYDEQGKEVFQSSLRLDYELRLPDTGTYYLALRSFGSNTDSYELAVVTPDLTSTSLKFWTLDKNNIDLRKYYANVNRDNIFSVSAWIQAEQ